MANVSLSPAQHHIRATPGRRLPLGVNHNAVNSPLQGFKASKRTRDQDEAQEDHRWDAEPHAKRQALEIVSQERRVSPRKHPLQPAEARVFTDKTGKDARSRFQQQLIAARDKPPQKAERQERVTQQNLKDIKQWQEHYRRAFPQFVFYFEGIAEEVRVRCSKYARSLGAREEKFFSKDVTHVVTTREIPTDNEAESCDTRTNSSQYTTSQASLKLNTIDPALLDKQSEHQHRQGKFVFEAGADKRVMLQGLPEPDMKKVGHGNNDILVRARDMGMKVWQLEKFQRMIRTMLEIPGDQQAHTTTTSRGRVATAGNTGNRAADLSKMLRNERLNGPSDRDATVAISELVPFKGPYIYIRDMDERAKPIMVRDYQKPTKGESGDWPQFHGNPNGRCPFVADPHREESEHPRQHLLRRKLAEAKSAPPTRSNARSRKEETPEVPPRQQSQQSQETTDAPELPQQSPARSNVPAFCPPPPRAQGASLRGGHGISDFRQRLIQGEPAASGLQPSNITSAIRSQAISSTAAAPGAKSGTSKEVHGLQRKVLQKNVPAIDGTHARAAGLDPAAIVRAERANPASRQTRRQAMQAETPRGDREVKQPAEGDVWMEESKRGRQAEPKKKSTKENHPRSGAKPGYCENCRDKYDDFEEHIVSRRHRKFALTKENWKDLDKLLAHLGRPLRQFNDSDDC